MTEAIKLSSRPTAEFWQIPVLFDDGHLLALDKPAGLPTAPLREAPGRADLMSLLHAGVKQGAAWATGRSLEFLRPVHRLDADASGVLVLARSKSVWASFVNWIGSGNGWQTWVALVPGTSATETFVVEAKLAPHPTRPGLMRRGGPGAKRALTRFAVRERFARYSLLQCQPVTDRPHQLRVHAQSVRRPLVGDTAYGGRLLYLSQLKPDYRFKAQQEEKPLLSRAALHHEQVTFPHPVTGTATVITAPWPKDLTVAIKYLRKFAAGRPVKTGI